MVTQFISNHIDYWLLVDTEAEYVEPGEKFLLGKNINEWRGTERRGLTELSHKIIGYLPKHKDAPALEGVPLLPALPEQEEEVEEMATKRKTLYGYASH